MADFGLDGLSGVARRTGWTPWSGAITALLVDPRPEPRIRVV